MANQTGSDGADQPPETSTYLQTCTLHALPVAAKRLPKCCKSPDSISGVARTAS